METSLHRSLKELYAADAASTEVAVDGYRIDAIAADGSLIEVQHAGLGSIRRKVIELTKSHRLRVVKPIVERKWIERYCPETNRRLSRRKSPKQATPVDIFGQLLHFRDAFPHPNLTLEIPLVEMIDMRHPRKPRRRYRQRDNSIDQLLVRISSVIEVRTNEDLWQMLGSPNLPKEFDTQELADAIQKPRWLAQQVTYVFRHSGELKQVGKRGNAIVYSRSPRTRKRPKPKAA